MPTPPTQAPAMEQGKKIIKKQQQKPEGVNQPQTRGDITTAVPTTKKRKRGQQHRKWQVSRNHTIHRRGWEQVRIVPRKTQRH